MKEDKDRREPEPLQTRKRYAPPAVQKVPLRPQEAVLGFCKNNAGGGPRGIHCTSVTACSLQGT